MASLSPPSVRVSFPPVVVRHPSGLTVHLVILYWDFVLTFSLEVQRYWGRKFGFNWTTLSFFACRYGSLFGHIPVILETVWPNGDDPVRTLYQRPKRHNSPFAS